MQADYNLRKWQCYQSELDRSSVQWNVTQKEIQPKPQQILFRNKEWCHWGEV